MTVACATAVTNKPEGLELFINMCLCATFKDELPPNSIFCEVPIVQAESINPALNK